MSTPGYDPYNPQGAPPGWDAPPPGYEPASPYTGGFTPAPSMGMGEAVGSVLTQYADFSGRARRSEFWWFYLASLLASMVASVIDQAVGSQLVQIGLGLVLFVPTCAVFTRRMHDTNHSGWWWLIIFVPIVGLIVLTVFLCTDSQPGSNTWGPSPKEPLAAGY